MSAEDLDQDSFGDTPQMADALLALVLAGKKTATCWAARHGAATHIGKQRIVCDGEGRPRAVIETVSLQRRRFCDVDSPFAAAEGEGDGTLERWRRDHRAFFEREGGFSETMDLYCERFRLVEALN
jgi:uncharacterized protein YhfF